MKKGYTIKTIYANGLCMGCGICQDVCPQNCIKIKNGNCNTAQLNPNNCSECGLCYAICPGKGIALNEVGLELFGYTKYNKYIGRYLNCYTGYSNNKDIRFHSASGGMVTQFLVYLFEKNLIDGAVVVGQQEENKMWPHPFIARNIADVLSSKSSKYCVTSYEGIIKEIKVKSGKYVVVGLPCHIQAFREYEKFEKKIKDSIIGHFSIYCSLNKTKASTDYYVYRYGIGRNTISEFAYRDDGCPGYMKFINKENKIIKKIPYTHYWMGTHNFFGNSRCALCFDQFGELSDISFGDINISPYNEDKIGINSLIARNKKWLAILLQAKDDGYITLKETKEKDLIDSQQFVQSYKKGYGISGALACRSLFGKKNPIYDETLPEANIKSIISYMIISIMHYMGRHQIFWPIIKRLDPYKN